MKDRIKKFWTNHADGIIAGTVAVTAIATSYYATNLAIKGGLGKLAIAGIDHDDTCKHPIYITFQDGRNSTWVPTPKEARA